MDGAKPAKSPCPLGSKLSRHDGELLLDHIPYRQLVGAPQYCTLTWPEIAYFVNQLCQHLHNPSSTHWTTAKRVLRYLTSSFDHGIQYTMSQLQLNAFCNFDWAGCLNDRRSTTGFAIFLGDCLISWSTKKQSVVSRSSIDAKYKSLAITTTEVFWLWMLFKQLRACLVCEIDLWNGMAIPMELSILCLVGVYSWEQSFSWEWLIPYTQE